MIQHDPAPATNTAAAPMGGQTSKQPVPMQKACMFYGRNRLEASTLDVGCTLQCCQNHVAPFPYHLSLELEPFCNLHFNGLNQAAEITSILCEASVKREASPRGDASPPRGEASPKGEVSPMKAGDAPPCWVNWVHWVNGRPEGQSHLVGLPSPSS